MAKYLTRFTDQAAWEAGEKQYPNVSLLDNGDVKYMAERPPYSGKAILTYQDGSVVEVADNGSSTLTSGEVSNRSALVAAEVGLSTTSIGQSAFSSASALTSVRIRGSIVNIGVAAFYSCKNLSSVIFDDESHLTTIDRNAFNGCNSLVDFDIPSNVTSLGDGVFLNCSRLTSITIPSGVTSIGTSGFASCKSIVSLRIPSGLTTIGENGFVGMTSLTSLTFDEGSHLSAIGNYAFSKCHCSSMVIPSGVTSIGHNAWTDTYLLNITFLSTTPPTADANMFKNTSANLVIYVPAESVEAYKSAPNWSTYASRIQVIQ